MNNKFKVGDCVKLVDLDGDLKHEITTSEGKITMKIGDDYLVEKVVDEEYIIILGCMFYSRRFELVKVEDTKPDTVVTLTFDAGTVEARQMFERFNNFQMSDFSAECPYFDSLSKFRVTFYADKIKTAKELEIEALHKQIYEANRRIAELNKGE